MLLLVIYSTEKPLRAFDGIVEVLIRPKHPVTIQSLRVEQVEVHPLQAACPGLGVLSRPTGCVMQQKVEPERIAVMVEGDDAIRCEDMVSRKGVAGNNAFRMKSYKGHVSQKHPRQDRAGTMAKEHSVGQHPTRNRILLNSWLQAVHGRTLAEVQPRTNDRRVIVYGQAN